MAVEVIGIDHVFVAVGDLGDSEEFYDRVMGVLGFRKGEATMGGDPHVVYHNRQFAYSLRPAEEGTPEHDPYAPGLHHLCFRVVDEAAVDRAAGELRTAGIDVTEPRYYPEYAPGTLAGIFSLYTRTEAAINGQQNMSELTGKPGNGRIPVTPPIDQNGRERAKTNRKNANGDLLLRLPAANRARTARSNCLTRTSRAFIVPRFSRPRMVRPRAPVAPRRPSSIAARATSYRPTRPPCSRAPWSVAFPAKVGPTISRLFMTWAARSNRTFHQTRIRPDVARFGSVAILVKLVRPSPDRRFIRRSHEATSQKNLRERRRSFTAMPRQGRSETVRP